MNTLLDIVLWGVDRKTAEQTSTAIISRISSLQKVLDCHDRDAETFRINRDAFTQEVKVSSRLMSAIRRGINDFHRTLGYFNVFAGTTYSAFKGGRMIHNQNLLPEQIIELDKQNLSIRFLKEFVSLDFGGIGKGMALDEAAEILKQHGIFNAFISFGGSSILTRGRHPHGNYWPFSFREKSIEHEVWQLNDDAVSVSCTKCGDINMNHIWNPIADKPVLTIQTSGIRSNSASDAEVLSTALVAAPAQWHRQIVTGFDVKKWAVFGP